MEGHSTEIHRTIFREVIDLPHIKHQGNRVLADARTTDL